MFLLGSTPLRYLSCLLGLCFPFPWPSANSVVSTYAGLREDLRTPRPFDSEDFVATLLPGASSGPGSSGDL